jgi:hypothetical protein
VKAWEPIEPSLSQSCASIEEKNYGVLKQMWSQRVLEKFSHEHNEKMFLCGTTTNVSRKGRHISMVE